ncbi:helix-turn-helix domain-containing protein [Paenibacillus sp. L3-i20]|nr:helix-turn-helix domain-containing protein [Paenibacillus sp. L3-i20]GKU79061.1 hypothetical protein L3i20_v234580 [Paenibacillus sp. L3-i20]
MSKNHFSAPEKMAILDELKNGEIGLKATAIKFGISKTTLVKWRRRYEV